MQIPRPHPEILAGSKVGPRNLYSEGVPSQPIPGGPDAGDTAHTQRGQAQDGPRASTRVSTAVPLQAPGSGPEVLIRAGGSLRFCISNPFSGVAAVLAHGPQWERGTPLTWAPRTGVGRRGEGHFDGSSARTE